MSKAYLYSCLISFFTFCNFAFAQEKDYFQQKVDYKIEVELDDKAHTLKGSITVAYTNNSPDSLPDLYFHLWPNAYKNDDTPLADQLSKQGSNHLSSAKLSDLGYIDLLSFRVDGKATDWEYLEDTIDVCVIHLKKALQPGAKIIISTPFRVKIPAASISRLGHEGESYLISQWYPKPAVYDVNGWNYFPYLDMGEYYSEFGNFDVSITLPKNYVVAATGALTDSAEIAWLNSKAIHDTDRTEGPVGIAKYYSGIKNPGSSFPLSDTAEKTLNFHAENVHDFAWVADKRFLVLKDEMELPFSKKKVTLWSFFTSNESSLWMKANGYAKDAVTYFSEWVGEYPYDYLTCVDVGNATGGGMEYPLLAFIGESGGEFDFENTIQHEVGHNWFYGILASNERRYPWMDEGMTQFLETRYVYTKYATDSAKQVESTGISGSNMRASYNHRKLEYLKYWRGARANTDQQPDLHSENYSLVNYNADAYRKTALSFDYLKSYLGDEMFDSCMHVYFNEWKFKHPQPKDVRKVFEKTSGKKLDWFFDGLLHSTKKVDYKISSLKRGGDSYAVKIKNTGSIASPVSLSGMKKGKVLNTEWHDGFSGAQSFTFNCTDCDAIKIDGEERIPEPRRRNNAARTSGIFRKIEKLKIQVPAAEEDPTRTQLFFAPLTGWNNYNKWMAGLSFHNLTLIEKRFEYLIAPLYSFASGEVVGSGKLSYNFYLNNSFLNKINLSVGASTYAFGHFNRYAELTGQHLESDLRYKKISSALTLSFLDRKKNPEAYSSLTLRHVYTEYDLEDSTLLNKPTDTVYKFQYDIETFHSHSYFISYIFGNQITFNPFHFNLTLGQTSNLGLASIEYIQTLSFNRKGRGLEYRVFAGLNGEIEEIEYSPSGRVDARFHMNGQKGNSNGLYQDYLFDEIFLGRSEQKGLLSQQFTATQGGFKAATDYAGQAKTWLAAVNIKVPFPGRVPLYFFADAGAFDKARVNSLKSETEFMFDGGIELRIIPKVFSVYFPLFVSGDIADVYDLFPDRYDTYWKKIRFELNISRLNPFILRDQIRF